jgi:hypothetical protein
MRSFPSALLLVAGVAGLCAQPPVTPPATSTEPVDAAAIEILRKHGLQHSQVMEHLSWLCDVYGPRVTGSRNLRRAQEWASKTLGSWGLTNARLESWGPFGRGWQCEHVSMTVLGDNPWPVIAYAKAWSPSLPGRVEAEVVAVGDLEADAVKALDLKGKVVLIESVRDVSEPFDAPARRLAPDDLLALADSAAEPRPRERNQRAGPASDFRAGFGKREAQLRLVAQMQPLAIVDRGFKGDYGTVFVQGAWLPSPTAAEGQTRPPRARPQDQDAPAPIPQFTLAVEHYNRMCRLLKKGIPVRVALELQTSFTEGDGMEHNVLADLPGSDAQIGDEVVMLGAHLDSWQAGTGATDNGCGSAVVMEAMRLLTVLSKESGRSPRRTIRCALWSGEEQGLLGSRAYVRQHFRQEDSAGVTAEHAKFAGYFNLDNGTGRIRGVYLQGNEAVAPIFRAWLKPFHDLDARTLTLNDTGGTDHQAFDAAGLPGFQFIQDPVAYSPRTHHSNMDNWDHASASDLQQAATIMASFAWHCAQRDEKLPRKPMPAPRGQ